MKMYCLKQIQATLAKSTKTDYPCSKIKKIMNLKFLSAVLLVCVLLHENEVNASSKKNGK